MKLSIVIPAYNSEDVLADTLVALAAQHIPQGWSAQAVIIDDGSAISPEAYLQGIVWPASWDAPLLYRMSHGGVAAARNYGIQHADGDVVLLLGSDILLRPGALERHCRFHEDNPDQLEAAVGMVRWDPRLAPTPLMEWMVHGGPQNNIDDMLGVAQVDPAHFFYGSHLSVKRPLLVQHPFPEVYEGYGWEDLDVGRSLAQAGLQLAVLHEAVGLHRHRYDGGSIKRRQYSAGRSAVQYEARYPKAQLFPAPTPQRAIKLFFYSLFGLHRMWWWAISGLGARYSLPSFFLLLTAAEFWRGWGKGKSPMPM